MLEAKRPPLRPVHPSGWWLDAAAVAAFLGVTLALLAPGVRETDLDIRDWSDAHRPDWADLVVQWLNRLGNGGPLTGICLVIAAVLAWRGRTLWPLAPVVAAFVLTGVVIQPLKLYFHRAAPHSPLPDEVEVKLFSQSGGLSYPSGHSVNTIVWYGLIVLLLSGWFATRPRLRTALRWVPPVLVLFTATYLGYHWLSDMLAGLCLGLVIDRLLWRVPWPRLTPG